MEKEEYQLLYGNSSAAKDVKSVLIKIE